jgi:hypothetical protein
MSTLLNKESGFYKLLTETYKLNITDDDYHRLITVLDHYKIEPGKLRIMLEDSVESFITNIHLMRKVECARTHTDIVFDDLLFLMREVPHGYDEEWSISIPQLAKHKASVADPEILKMPQNLALIRTLQIQSREKVDISEKFFLAIYNDELNVVAGIRFEKIS